LLIIILLGVELAHYYKMKNLLIIIFVKNKGWLLQRKAERGKIKYLIYITRVGEGLSKVPLQLKVHTFVQEPGKDEEEVLVNYGNLDGSNMGNW